MGAESVRQHPALIRAFYYALEFHSIEVPMLLFALGIGRQETLQKEKLVQLIIKAIKGKKLEVIRFLHERVQFKILSLDEETGNKMLALASE